MKLMLCRHCGDVVKMLPEERTCACGKSRGRYLADLSTVEQTEGALSLALHNHDLRTAIAAFDDEPRLWHPLMVFRAYLNPLCESDVRYVAGEPDDASPEARTPPEAPPHAEDSGGTDFEDKTEA